MVDDGAGGEVVEVEFPGDWGAVDVSDGDGPVGEPFEVVEVPAYRVGVVEPFRELGVGGGAEGGFPAGVAGWFWGACEPVEEVPVAGVSDF